MLYVTPHFKVSEFACHSGISYPTINIDQEDDLKRSWYETRLIPLAQTLEVIRAELGGPIHINSGYRTFAYDEVLYEQSAKDGSVATPQGSQHPKGRAADIVAAMLPKDLHALILRIYNHDKLPFLGGLGLYKTFCHIDVRPRVPVTHLAQWCGERTTNFIKV